MKERPILFSAPMVRAILSGQKTQTRRVVKLPHENRLGVWEPMLIGGARGGRTAAGDTIPEQGAIWHTRTADCLMCPHGQPGDRLWVREVWSANYPEVRYRADASAVYFGDSPRLDDLRRLYDTQRGDWRPSIHMPRWASRITLEITSVRVERLQQISEVDAVAEGLEISSTARRSDTCYGIYECRMPDGKTHFDDSAVDLYRKLWEQINGADSWKTNPWVWVVDFTRVTL